MPDSSPPSSDVRLSYKFQRLREQLRAAVASGELSGKLPGERELARRFNVNAKTLGKALTDLAAEGLLDRAVGRGTYVKGAVPEPSETRWLVLIDDPLPAESVRVAWIDALRHDHPALVTHSGPVDQLRPSFLNGFSAVIDLAHGTPDAFIRELIVRNLPVVAAGYEPHATSVNSVVIDRVLGVSKMARKAVLDGHRRIGIVAGRHSDDLLKAARQSAAFEPASDITLYAPADVRAAVQDGKTMLISDCVACSRQVLDAIGPRSAIDLVTVGGLTPGWACAGFYVTPQQISAAIVERLSAPLGTRPAVVYLAGTYVEGALGSRDAACLPSATQPKYSPRFY